MGLSQESTVQELIEDIECGLTNGFSHLLEDSRECELCGKEEWDIDTVIAKASVETHLVDCQKCEGDYWTERIMVSIRNVELPTTQDRITVEACPGCDYKNNPVQTLVESKEHMERKESDYRFVRYITNTKIAWHHTSYLEQKVMAVCPSCHSKIHNKPGFREDLRPKISRTEAKARGLLYD